MSELVNTDVRGYGKIYKRLMRYPGLSLIAKAIYAYFASFAGAGTTAFPRRTTIMRELHMSEKTYYKHFKQLTDTHYITVEQRKSNGRFDVSLYRLADTVAPFPFPGAPNGKAPKKSPVTPPQKGMSEKVQPGGKLQNGTSSVTDNVMSEKVASDEIPQGKSSHANKKNSSITNISEKEQDHNQQAADETEAAVYSLEDAKHIIRYEFLLSEAAAWGELKELLNHYKTPEDKERYFRISPQIVLALAKQAANMLNVSRNPEAIIAQLQGEGLYDLFSELLDRWDAIQSIQSYVGRALANLVGTWDCGE